MQDNGGEEACTVHMSTDVLAFEDEAVADEQSLRFFTVVGPGVPNLVPASPCCKIPAFAPGSSPFTHPVHEADATSARDMEDLFLSVTRAGERSCGVWS